MFLEVVATSVEDCRVLNQFTDHVNRIELCVNLKKGGLTPDFSLIEKCLKVSKIPINVMLRLGKRFVLNEKELEELKQIVTFIIDQFSHFSSLNGFVFGALTKDKKLDFKAFEEIIKIVNSYKVLCHRCFEEVINKNEAIIELEKLGVKEILYSALTINELSKLQLLSNTKVKFLIGGGVNFNNKIFLLNNGFTRLHIGSCVREKEKWSKPILSSKLRDFINLRIK